MRIDMHRLQELVRLHRMGTGARDVARTLRMSPNTERRYREALRLACLLEGDPEDLPELGELREAVLAELPPKKVPQQISSVDRWLDQIHKMAARGAYPKAIYDKLRLDSPEFEGTLSAVKRAWKQWKKVRGVQAEDVAIPVETRPGEIGQVDFGYVGMLVDPAVGKPRRAWVFVMVLSHSRHMFAKIVFDQKATTWVQLHIEAFAEFGGVVETVVPDNLKAAVIRAAFGIERDDSGLNRTYRELARYYGFRVDPTPPRSPKKKGRAESGVKYVKNNFFKPRALEALEPAQIGLRRWRFEIAGTREHGTTGRKPLEVFEQEERPALLPLPAVPYVPVIWKQATLHANCHLVYSRREYSAPWKLCGERLWVRATPETVCIYANDNRVATHDPRDPGPRSTIESHLPEHRRDLRHRSRKHWMERARKMDEAVEIYIGEVFGSEDVISKLRVVQAIVTLLEKHPPSRATAACERARFYGAYTYVAVRDILRKGLDFEPLPPTLFPASALTPAPVKPRSRPRFSRAPTPTQDQRLT